MTKRYAPATQRNREPILEVLRKILPPQGLVLEVASGTGEHSTFFASQLPGLTFQPSDPSFENRQSVASWAVELAVSNVRKPLALDVREDPWPLSKVDAVLAINLIHIAPWEATTSLMRGAAKALVPSAPLFLYGPYFQKDRPTAPSNVEFDQSLRDQDPTWGVRQLEDVVAEAKKFGLALEEIVEMPANNLSVIFRNRR